MCVQRLVSSSEMHPARRSFTGFSASSSKLGSIQGEVSGSSLLSPE